MMPRLEMVGPTRAAVRARTADFPLAIALTFATVWVLAWSFPTGRTARRGP